MKQLFLLLSLVFPVTATLLAQVQNKPTDYVNPIIGTNGMGHTFPGACVPFGAVQLSPDVDTIPQNINGRYVPKVYEYCAGYQYADNTIVGFSHTHLSGTGHSDLGDVLIMPATGPVKLNPGRANHPGEGYRSRYSHTTESARPGYYEVTLADYNIHARLTATKRTGIHQYTFPKGEKGHLIIDLVHSIYNYDGKVLWSSLRVENDTLITGYRITNGWARQNYTYFAISFSQPISEYGYKDKKKPLYTGFWRRFNLEKNFPEIAGRSIVAWFAFDTDRQPELTVKVALSGVSTAGALANLHAEASGKTFDRIEAEAESAWNNHLAGFQIQGTANQKAMFYTSLYHTMINPSVYMDVDRQYRGLDGNIHTARNFTNYTIFSLWDTYRAEHPFLNIAAPKANADMVESMLQHQRQSVHGMLPVWSLMANENWCMSGYHAVSVLADALAKGTFKDSQSALQAMVKTSTVPYYDNLADYMKTGYVHYDHSATAASATLEYAYDDWCIYATALKAGRTDIAETYRKRALNYRNVINPATGFACPRYADGSFKKDYDPLQTYGEGFIEGNGWNFSFQVPHDVQGLIGLMGGQKAFVDKLDKLFTMHLPDAYFEKNEDITRDGLVGGYVHGNEPSHHIPYLYAWTNQPWKAQYWLREIMNKMYRNNINGLGGNDDCGQMSAWYIFTAMGFYPVCPGTDQYVLGAPYLPYIKVVLPGGNTLEIKAPGVSDKKRYVKALKINGQIYPHLYITHNTLLRGGVWEFEMSATPNKKRGLAAADKPYSLTN